MKILLLETHSVRGDTLIRAFQKENITVVRLSCFSALKHCVNEQRLEEFNLIIIVFEALSYQDGLENIAELLADYDGKVLGMSVSPKAREIFAEVGIVCFFLQSPWDFTGEKLVKYVVSPLFKIS